MLKRRLLCYTNEVRPAHLLASLGHVWGARADVGGSRTPR